MTDTASNDKMDLLVHSRERIAATPAVIWPYIAALNWFSFPKLVPIAGQPGSVGERFAAYFDEALETVAYYAVNVELTAGCRRTLRIEGLDDVPMGFTTFELIPNGSETIVMYDVCVRAAPPEGLSSQDVLVQSERAGAETLLQLKNIIEG